jgi:hypothetical protein
VLNAGAVTTDYNGKANTAKIVSHAQRIIGGYLKESRPTTMTELADAMQALIAANSSSSVKDLYDEFYYPAAYGCYLYEPTAKGTVDEAYKSGQWYLPGCGELCRIYNFYRWGTSADNADFEAASEARTPIIANAASKAGKSVMASYGGWCWSSSENSRDYSWYVSSSGLVNYNPYGVKYYQFIVRPCSAFIFNLLP